MYVVALCDCGVSYAAVMLSCSLAILEDTRLTRPIS